MIDEGLLIEIAAVVLRRPFGKLRAGVAATVKRKQRRLPGEVAGVVAVEEADGAHRDYCDYLNTEICK